MKNNIETKSNSRHEASKSAKDKLLSPRASRSSSVLKLEQPIERPHADQHPETMENTNDGQKKQAKKATGAEELVKFMSDVPCYLQRRGRGDNIQEKALNFGVLDWNRLERWKHEQKKVLGGRNVHSSLARSCTLSSTLGSSTKPVGSACETSSHAPKKQFPTLDFYLNISAKEGHSEARNERSSGQPSNDVKPEFKRDQSIVWQHQRSEHERSNRHDLGSNAVLHNTCRTSESALSNSKHITKGKTKARDGESKSRVEEFQESGLHLPDKNCAHGLNTYEFLSIREYPDVKSPESCLRAFHDVRPTEINRKIFSEDFHFDFTLSSDIPHSCPFPCSSQNSEWPGTNIGSSVDFQDTETSSNGHHSCADSCEVPITQTKGKYEEEQNHSVARSADLPVFEIFNGPGPIKAKASKATTRNPSPCRRSTSGLDKTTRSFSFREVSDAQQVNLLTSTPVTHSNSSNRDKASSSNRAKSSPLKRILDPLLRPKSSKHLSSDNPFSGSHEDDGTHKHQSDDTLASTNGASSPNASSNCCPHVKRNLNFSTCVSASANTYEKNPGSKKRAVLQITHKNGLPFFTFTFNESDVLATMMRKVYVSGKNDFEWVYTFYSVHEVKKNKKWINQGSKRKLHGYASTAVGQMKVSWSQCQKLAGDDFNNHVMAGEFVLFGAELKQPADDTLDLLPLPSSELAAVIIKAPKEKESFSGCVRQSNSLQMEPTKCLPQERDSCYLAENQSHSSILVILPGGVHSQPAAAGIPSTLIERWRTGGSCDCGGWDEGCTLRVLSSQGQGSDSLRSSHACHLSNETPLIDLFVQGGAQENRHVFSLAFCKEGLYTVDFNESISLLQAFSVCIAILHGRKAANISELLNILEIKSSPDPQSIENDQIKDPNRSQGEIPLSRSQRGMPTSYVPYPPHSPVGRV